MTIDLDEQGYLVDWQDWTEDLAGRFADADGITLTDEHWAVLRLLRDYYGEFGIAPPMRALLKLARERLGDDWSDSRRLYQLFPDGPAKQACRYAGLPKPVSCI